jgi:hypothetical protein
VPVRWFALDELLKFRGSQLLERMDFPAQGSRMYQAGDQMMAVSYTAKGDAFVAEKPRVWIAKLGGTAWDLAPRRQARGGGDA